jgi:uncharacterized protein (TIGR03437 family)
MDGKRVKETLRTPRALLSPLSSHQIGTGDPLGMPKKFITLLFLGCLLAHAQSISVQKPSLLWLSTHVAQAQAPASAVPNSWSTGTPMPTSRETLLTAVIGQKIYALGGRAGSTILNVNEVYDTTTNTWTTAAPMLTARWDGATAVVNNILYAIGGGTNSSSTSNIVEAYDPTSNTWSTKAAMPISVNSIYAVVENGIIYVVGGYNGARVNTVVAYDPAADTWSTLAPLNVAKSQPALGLIGSMIVAAGGLTNSGVTTDNEGYNAATNSWTTLAALPTARQAGCFGVSAGLLYFASGDGVASGSLLNTMDAYDASTNSWASGLPQIPNSITNPGSAVVGESLYCIGGSNTFKGTAYNYVQIYQPALQPPSIGAGGVVSASAFGEFTSVSPGSWIEIYGSNLAVDSRSWLAADFNGVNAPTSLDGTSVTIGGQAAFIDFISTGQVNALVPSNVATGTQPITVTVGNVTSATYSVTVNPVQPGLDAPSSFNIVGTQYAVALFADGAYVLPEGAIAGLNSRPAQPGDEIVLYGIGFGPVKPNIPAGQLVQQANTLESAFSMSIGGVPVANVPYSGLAPNYTGLYQFNVVVPANTGSGAVPLTFSVGDTAGTQTLYLAVGN